MRINQISDISPLNDLADLQTLDLRHNQIFEVPIDFLKKGFDFFYEENHYSITSKKFINFFGNPLVSPPKEVILQGQEAIKAYYESLKQERIIIKEVKLLFLGEGSAGKTTLMKNLLGDKVNPNELQTHGINQQKWMVDDEIQVNMWDFGGQEIQHSVHQFFLTERSIYVLVLDNRKEEKPEYWLQHILSLAGDSPIVVVSNKIDEDAHKIDQFDASFLKEKYPNIMGFYHVSALHNINITDLKSNLEKLIRQHIFPVFSTDWVKIKNTVEESISLGKNYMTVETYKTHCEDLQIPDNQQITLLDYLNNTGTLSYFGKNLHTKGLYILNPEWLTYGVYKILLAEKTINQAGEIEVNDFDGILKQVPTNQNFYSKKVYAYEHKHFGFLLEMMKHFELCYSPDNQRVIIPSAFRISFNTQFDKNDCLQFFFWYPDFLPSSIMSRFIVRLFPKRKGGAYWRLGIELHNKDTNAEALVQMDKEAKKIYIYVRGEQRREFFQEIRRNFREINQSFEKMNFEEHIPLVSRTKGESVDYLSLINHELENEHEYFHAKTRERFIVKNLLAGIENSKITNEEKQKRQMEDRNVFNINVSPHIENKPVFNNTISITGNQDFEKIKDYLLDLEELATENKMWQETLIKALDEFNRLEDATDKAEQKTSIRKIDRIFKKLKDVKDWTAISLLPAEIATKGEKMLSLWEDFKHLF